MVRGVQRHSQQGYALLELALALLLTTLLAAWGAHTFMNRYNDAQAQAAAVWMESVHKAVIAYIKHHGPAIQTAFGPGDIVLEGFTDWAAPTIRELVQAGFLSSGIPESTRLTGSARIDVWRGGSCPGNGCIVEALVHGRRPLYDDARNEPREAMLAQWLLAARGHGAAVHGNDPTRIRGASFAFDSMLPDGTQLPVGTVGMAVTAEHLALWNYLRVRDPRDPDFQGDLSAAGQLVIGAQSSLDTACEPEFAVAHDQMGGLMVCRSSRWRSAGRSGGGYGYNSRFGCQTPDGAPTANPLTNQCSCPPFAAAVLILEFGEYLDANGKQQAYLCVG